MKDSKALEESLRLYAVTDRSWLQGTLAEDVEKSILGGVSFLQLREKELPDEEFIKEALIIQKIAKNHHIPFVINDNVAVAVAVDADGVHVGQKDMETGDVRQKLGHDKIIGVSVQTVEQALLAEKNGADYLGVGAVYSTSTKLDATVVAYDTLKEICRAVKIPVVAIGGITEQNISELAGSGILGVAVISAIFAKKNIELAAKRVLEAVSKIV